MAPDSRPPACAARKKLVIAVNNGLSVGSSSRVRTCAGRQLLLSSLLIMALLYQTRAHHARARTERARNAFYAVFLYLLVLHLPFLVRQYHTPARTHTRSIEILICSPDEMTERNKQEKGSREGRESMYNGVQRYTHGSHRL